MRVILLKKTTGEDEIFSSLRPFFDKYPELKKDRDSIYYALSRKRVPFTGKGFVLKRLPVQKPER